MAGLERVVLALFVLVSTGFLLRLVGWRPDWLLAVYQISAVAFILMLLTYLNVGGAERVTKSKVGVVGLVLLGFALIGNLADALFDIDSPPWEEAEDVVVFGFLVCFVAYVVVRISLRVPDKLISCGA
ncbi:hypothetical protein [Actinosynnema sp. ALI-1.44]|uniref:hypothetical protein n=1 Tax=Actinosynnema sp. ALI-1.44 TaxID=1933779 RepID=UPI001177EC05|nr:hypothetical protein [Actinosynnema sp. ALI-1.44]